MVVLSFDKPSYSIPEANVSVEVCVNLIGVLEKAIVANISTSDGSALGKCHIKQCSGLQGFIADLIIAAGVDYTPVSIEIEFNSKVAMQCQAVQVISDTILEIDEMFFVTLEISDPDVLLENNMATIVIEDDDRKLLESIYYYTFCG